MEYRICPKTNKRCYSKEDARHTVNMARKRHWKSGAADVPKRIYYCETCRAWHLTKQEAKFDGNKKQKSLSLRYTNERRRIARMEEDIYRYSREYR